jgi:hypothetical protein
LSDLAEPRARTDRTDDRGIPFSKEIELDLSGCLVGV